jgi:hypothetical protein
MKVGMSIILSDTDDFIAKNITTYQEWWRCEFMKKIKSYNKILEPQGKIVKSMTYDQRFQQLPKQAIDK